MGCTSFADRESRVEVYSAILALLPARPTDVISAIDDAYIDATDSLLGQKLLLARRIAEGSCVEIEHAMLAHVLSEPPSALGQLDLTDPLGARQCIKPRNTAPPPSVCNI